MPGLINKENINPIAIQNFIYCGFLTTSFGGVGGLYKNNLGSKFVELLLNN